MGFLALLLGGCAVEDSTKVELSSTTETAHVLEVGSGTQVVFSSKTVVDLPIETLVPTRSPTHIPTKTPSVTETTTSTWTETPTATTSITPSKTPDFKVTGIPKTPTPGPAAECPSDFQKDAPSPDFIGLSYWEWSEDTEDQILNYFNTYGPKPIINEFTTLSSNQRRRLGFINMDLTNDTVPEISFISGKFYIFGCHDGKYSIYYTQRHMDAYFNPYYLVYSIDGNRNGIPELTFVTHIWSQSGHAYAVLEWNGSYFHNLILNEDPKFPESGDIFVEATGRIYFEDMDNDWIKEIVVEKGIGISGDASTFLPWGHEINYYKWDGEHYVLYKIQFVNPKYRYQAVQYGDMYTIEGDYERALEMYQMAIFDESLEWWSMDRKITEQERWLHVFPGTPTPTLPPTDPNEYPILVSYARFRIMLLFLVQGWEEDAKIIYETLLEKFPTGTVGNEIALMAAEFWDEYQKTKDKRLACAKAVSFAEENPEILYYLGG